MASNYPNALDSFTDPLSTSPLNSPSHSTLHADVNDAIEKIEAYVPRRNFLYNGAMQVHQRGTSTASITTSGYYTADRWNLLISSLGTWTQTVENDAPTGSGFRKSLKMLCTTADASPAAGDYAIIQQILEGQDLQSIRKGTSSAQQLTMSFWVKSNRTGTYVCQLNDDDNSRSVSATYTVSASGTWEYKTVTFPADTTGALDNDNAASLTVRWWLGAGSTFTSGTLNTTWQSTVSGNIAVGQVNVAGTVNNYWQVTGVQLNLGAVAAPFEFKDYGRELRECQRYCVRWGGASTFGYDSVGIGIAASTTAGGIVVPLPVQMRLMPTSVSFNGARLSDTISSNAISAITINAFISGDKQAWLDCTTTALTQYRAYALQAGNGTPSSNFVQLSAEL